MIDSLPFVEPPDRERLARRADDLRQRATLVRRYGWDQYRHRWSSGEVLGAALVMDDQAELQRCGETTDSALSTWAFTLWGITGGQSDTAAGLPSTRAWFAAIRCQATR
ncbi:hypothetical protein [[Mycobacterium] vasticus]|uniref:Uncharacterized protein n=1 Tax=[Mycobacterium] vasticus TaxID=2875777 RepID=A0ABU5YYH3_9MYCO|nr:hypothetical protein [Mycolicibacter sp. MYC017]MEB3070158.1 hypothetical protein [Mycolicibacter sp. MYC017]